MVFTARGDGVVDIWDYFDKQHEPVLSTQVRRRKQVHAA